MLSVLESTIRDYARGNHFSGNILIQHQGKTIYHKSFGIADRAFDVPITTDTRFRVASVTKAFTAVLILQLSENGKLSLNKTIKSYLPAYRGEAGDKATLTDLLNHTSGMENFDAEIKSYEDALKNGIPHYQMPFTTDQLLNRFCSGRLVHEPGKVFDYNNGEYIILGKIIEKITGKTYDQFLQERILRPLGMKNSGMLYQHDIVKNLASTYMTQDKGKSFSNDMPVYFENWYAAGAMYSTTSDLLKFMDALYGMRLLKAESLNQLLTPGLEGYGYGVWIGEMTFGGRQYRAVNRPGRIMGANASTRHFSGVGFDTSVNIVVLSNTNAADLDDFSFQIGKTILDRP